MNNYSHVTNYVSKAEQTPDVGDVSIQPKLKACSGLANLENKKYKVAAQKFLETNFNLTDFSDVCLLVFFFPPPISFFFSLFSLFFSPLLFYFLFCLPMCR
jgi:hypothetical protein